MMEKLLQVFPSLLPASCTRVRQMNSDTVGQTLFVHSLTFPSTRRPQLLRHNKHVKTICFSTFLPSCAPWTIHSGLSKGAGGGGDSP